MSVLRQNKTCFEIIHSLSTLDTCSISAGVAIGTGISCATAILLAIIWKSRIYKQYCWLQYIVIAVNCVTALADCPFSQTKTVLTKRYPWSSLQFELIENWVKKTQNRRIEYYKPHQYNFKLFFSSLCIWRLADLLHSIGNGFRSCFSRSWRFKNTSFPTKVFWNYTFKPYCKPPWLQFGFILS